MWLQRAGWWSQDIFLSPATSLRRQCTSVVDDTLESSQASKARAWEVPRTVPYRFTPIPWQNKDSEETQPFWNRSAGDDLRRYHQLTDFWVKSESVGEQVAKEEQAELEGGIKLVDGGNAVQGLLNVAGGAGARVEGAGAKAAMLRMRNRGLLKAMTKWMGLWEELHRAKLYLMDAYEQMCRSQNTPALGLSVLKRLMMSPHCFNIKVLDFSGINWGPAGARAFGNVMRGVGLNGELLESPSLTSVRSYCGCPEFETVRCADCRLAFEGGRDVVDMLIDCRIALKMLDLSSNAVGPRGADFLVRILNCSHCPLQWLVADDNALGDNGVAAIAAAATASSTLTRLSLRKNHAAAMSGAALGQMLKSNITLLNLDLGGNDIHGVGAADLADGLLMNKILQTLDLARNGFGGNKAIRALARAVKHCYVQELNLSDNHVGEPSVHIFVDGLKKNSHLHTVILDGNPIQMNGARELFKQMGFRADGSFSRVISLKNCMFQIVAPCLLNLKAPAGFYSLQMQEDYAQSVMHFLISLQLKGDFEFDTGVGMYIPEPTKDRSKDSNQAYSMSFSGDPSAWELPKKGLLEFRFVDKRSHAAEKAAAAKAVVDILRQYSSRESLFEKRRTVSQKLQSGEQYCLYEQLVERMLLIPRTDSEARIKVLALSALQLINGGDYRIFPLIFQEEKLRIQNLLNLKPSDSLINFSNGHYNIDLSLTSLRNIAMRLQTLKNNLVKEETMALESLNKKGMPFSVLDSIELVWRNLMLDGVHTKYSDLWLLPHKGILQLDFVDIRRADSEQKAMSDDEFRSNIMEKWLSKSKLLRLTLMQPNRKLALLQEIAMSKFFLCHQIVEMIMHFSPTEHSEIRVEIFVLCWSRTIDWHGLRNVLAVMTPRERSALQYRIGALNLYDEMMAVGFYELELDRIDERFLFLEFIRLTQVEPGSMMSRLCLDGAEWSIQVVETMYDTDNSVIPRTGLATFFFVRTSEVIEVVLKQGAYHHSRNFPLDVTKSTFCADWVRPFCSTGQCLPSGTAWIQPWLDRNVIMKMQQKFESAGKVLDQLEVSDDQCFSMEQMISTVASFGIWFYPLEYQSLLINLDTNNNGRISIDTFQAFWSIIQCTDK